MKAMVSLVVLVASWTCAGQSSLERLGFVTDAPRAATDPKVSTAKLRNFVPRDPWRIIDGGKQYAKGDGWKQFHGTVLSVGTKGILLDGRYYTPGEPASEKRLFFVANFPYSVVDGDSVFGNLSAKEAGTYSYTSAVGGLNTVRKLDYGKVCDPPSMPAPSDESIKAAAAAEEKKKADAAARGLRYDQERAERGEVVGCVAMAKRYLNGDGVEQDPVKARGYLAKAADKGDEEAAAMLKALPQTP